MRKISLPCGRPNWMWRHASCMKACVVSYALAGCLGRARVGRRRDSMQRQRHRGQRAPARRRRVPAALMFVRKPSMRVPSLSTTPKFVHIRALCGDRRSLRPSSAGRRCWKPSGWTMRLAVRRLASLAKRDPRMGRAEATRILPEARAVLPLGALGVGRKDRRGRRGLRRELEGVRGTPLGSPGGLFPARGAQAVPTKNLGPPGADPGKAPRAPGRLHGTSPELTPHRFPMRVRAGAALGSSRSCAGAAREPRWRGRGGAPCAFSRSTMPPSSPRRDRKSWKRKASQGVAAASPPVVHPRRLC